MALNHLTDSDIQNYLDGNLTHKQISTIEQHIADCESCKNEVANYHELYQGLKEDTGFKLSPNFSQSIILKIQGDLPITFHIRIRDVFLSVIGLIFALGITLYYVDFKPLIKVFSNNFSAQIGNSIAVVSNMKGLHEGLNLDFNLFLFAGSFW